MGLLPVSNPAEMISSFFCMPMSHNFRNRSVGANGMPQYVQLVIPR